MFSSSLALFFARAIESISSNSTFSSMILLIISSVKWSRVYSHSQTVYTLVIDHFNIGLLTRRGLGGGHFQNTIRVNIKGDFNTRNTLWRRRNVFQYKRGQFVVVLEINPFLKTSYSGFCFFSFINFYFVKSTK